MKTKIKNLKNLKKNIKKSKKNIKIMRGGVKKIYTLECSKKTKGNNTITCTIQSKTTLPSSPISTPTPAPTTPAGLALPPLDKMKGRIDLTNDYPSLVKLFDELDKKRKSGLNDIFVFDFDDTLVQHSNGIPIKLVDINATGQLIKLEMKFESLSGGRTKIIYKPKNPEEIIEERTLNDTDYSLKVEDEQYNLLKEMFTAIRVRNANNIIIILSRGVEKLIELFFKNKLPELQPFFILGANNRDDINNGGTKRWAEKKASAINYIYDFTEANIMFYDDTEANINEVNEDAKTDKKPKIKAFLVPGYQIVFDTYKESLKSLNTT